MLIRGVSLPSLHLAESTDLEGKGQWQQVPAQHGRHILSGTSPPSQVPVHNRYEALHVDLNNTEEHGTSVWKVTPSLRLPLPCIKTVSTKNKRRVIIVGHFLLKGTGGPVCRLNLLHRDVLPPSGPD